MKTIDSTSLEQVEGYAGHSVATSKRSLGVVIVSLVLLAGVLLTSGHQPRHSASKAKPAAVLARHIGQQKMISSLERQGVGFGSCPHGASMQIVAHPDDDILFMNPDIAEDIQAKKCSTTIYVTAGDNGDGMEYVSQREVGIKSAYAQMAGLPIDQAWAEKPVHASGKTIQIAALEGGVPIQLIFMRLYDGNVQGAGYDGRPTSLALSSKNNVPIGSMDDATRISTKALENLLAALVHVYTPDTVRTHALSGAGDHSDHMATGKVTRIAMEKYKESRESFPTKSKANPVFFLYDGYPIRGMQTNISGQQEEAKRAFFYAYAVHDSHICPDGCIEGTGSYEDYLSRQYKNQATP
ncbi:MAG: hypothetical protein QG629_439 [Patescibacteria group bacterium]|nr:PIG-L family deacetylase [Candidatus Saccharibacteria bacterium]MDQ5963357.1 hypothetical protein [Patescibacteria group bacterium]